MVNKDIAIKLTNLNVGYVNNILIKNISIFIKENEFILLTGPKDSGKTTFIETIIGLKKPLSGHIHVFDNRTFLDYKHLIGYIPQEIMINNPNFSVLDVVLMGLVSNKPWFPKINKEDKKLAKKSLKKVGFNQDINMSFCKISQSERIKCLIARALVNNQKILILDEIESNLDTKSKNELLSLLSFLKKKKNITFLISTKEFNLFNTLVDKVLLLGENDKDFFFDKPENVITDDILSKVYNVNLKSLKTNDKKIYISYN